MTMALTNRVITEYLRLTTYTYLLFLCKLYSQQATATENKSLRIIRNDPEGTIQKEPYCIFTYMVIQKYSSYKLHPHIFSSVQISIVYIFFDTFIDSGEFFY